MGLKKEIVQMLLSALLLSIFIQFEWLSPDRSFINNLTTAIVLYVVVRVLALFFR